MLTHKKNADIILIIAYSLLIMGLMLFGNKDAFYVDDNIMQWGPVIQKAFDQIFSGEGIPYHNFYQYKGIDIFSSGYYGLYSPFMYISYIISRFLTKGSLTVLTVHIIIMYFLGNIFMYLLLREFSSEKPAIVLSLFAYSVSVLFFEFAFYYFTFNNYFFLPFLLFIIVRTKGKRSEWFVPGITLAFGMLLGHVQYCCYYVMVYCILNVVFAVRERKPSYILKIFVTIAIFLLLSCMSLILSAQSSADRDKVIGGNQDFYSYWLNIADIFAPFYMIFPMDTPQSLYPYDFIDFIGIGAVGIFAFMILIPEVIKFTDIFIQKVKPVANKLYSGKEKKYVLRTNHVLISLFLLLMIFKFYFDFMKFNKMSIISYTALMIIIAFLTVLVCIHSFKSGKNFMLSKKMITVYFMLILFDIMLLFTLPFYVAAIILYTIKSVGSDKENNKKEDILHAMMFAAFFFILFSMGSKGLIAVILEHIPLIKEFRYLYKCAFVFIPILIPVSCFMLGKTKKFRKITYTISALCSIICLINIFLITRPGNHSYINNYNVTYSRFRQYIPQTKQKLEENHTDKNNYRFVAVAYYYDDLTKIAGNLCTYAFTKNCATPFGVFALSGYDNIYRFKSYRQSDRIVNTLFDMWMNGMCFIDEEPSGQELHIFEKQIIQNGIKYIILSKPDEYYDTFKEFIDRCEKIKIAKTSEWIDDTILIELYGVYPICSYDNGKKITLTKTYMDKLNFQTKFDKPTDITISMTYSNNYRISLTDDSGKVTDIIPTETKDGYVSATIPPGSYSASFYYKNILMDIAMILAGMTCCMMFVSMIFVFKTDRTKR